VTRLCLQVGRNTGSQCGHARCNGDAATGVTRDQAVKLERAYEAIRDRTVHGKFGGQIIERERAP